MYWRAVVLYWINMSKIIVAIDSFKGCLTSAEANQAAAEGILQKMPDAEVIQIPVAASVFAPQKGATPGMVTALDARARQFAEKSALHFGYDRQEMTGAGAAGGLGYAFLQYLNADCRPGIDLLLDAVRFNDILEGAERVITGEGAADSQTLMGKLPYGILQRAKQYHVP